MLSGEIEVACRAAHAAGRVLMEYFRSKDLQIRDKGRHDPVTIADLRANEIILHHLRQAYPQDSILTEESPKEPSRTERQWVVDPMDGTLEFIHGSEDFCVMIGLSIQHHPKIGVVYHPPLDRLYAGKIGGAVERIDGLGSARETRKAIHLAPLPAGSSVRLVHSKNHQSRRLAELLQRFSFSSSFAKGSAGLKCMALLEDEADVYVHPSREIKEWDTCAAEAIVRAAGGEMLGGNFEALSYGKSDPRHPHGITAFRPGLPENLRSIVREVSPGSPH